MPTLERTPVTTPAPLTPATTTVAQASPAPQRAGNAAALERAGLDASTPAPTAASTGLASTLDALGETASVVLDALPLGLALPLALARRAEPWAATWLRSQDEAAVFASARPQIADAFDAAWPVGMGIRLDGMLGGSLGVGVVGRAALGAERVANGLRVAFRGSVTGEHPLLAYGAKATGAEDATLAGAEAEAKLEASRSVEAEWLLDVPTLLAALVAERAGRVGSVLLGECAPERLTTPIERLVTALPPTSLRIAEDARGVMGAETTLGLTRAAVSGAATAGGGIGYDARGPFVDVHIGQSTAASGAHWLLVALARVDARVPRSLGRAVGGDLRVRLRGAADALAAKDLDALSFDVTATAVEDDRTLVDDFTFADAESLVAWLVSLANPVAAALAPEGAPVPTASLPERTLSRSVTRKVGDAAEALALAPSLAGIVEHLETSELEHLDVSTDGSIVDVDVDARLEGRVAVPTEAVRAALAHGTLTPGPDGVEAGVLEVARAVAAHVIGGTVYEVPGVELDLQAAAEEVETSDLEIVLEAEARLGAGGALGVVLPVGGKADVGATITVREPLADLPIAERKALLSGA